MKKLILFFSTVYILTLLTTSCEYEFNYPKKIVIPDTVKVSFANDIMPILNGCNCHFSGSPGGLSLAPPNTYANLMSKTEVIPFDTLDASKLIYKFLGSETHVGRLTGTDLTWIRKWIKEGAKDN